MYSKLSAGVLHPAELLAHKINNLQKSPPICPAERSPKTRVRYARYGRFVCRTQLPCPTLSEWGDVYSLNFSKGSYTYV